MIPKGSISNHSATIPAEHHDGSAERMAAVWLEVLSGIDRLTHPVKSKTILDCYTPTLPWNYLWEFPNLYGFFHSGKISPGRYIRKAVDHPHDSVLCRKLSGEYSRVVSELCLVRTVLHRDMILFSGERIRSLHDAGWIDRKTLMAGFIELEKALGRLHADCIRTKAGDPIAFYYTTPTALGKLPADSPLHGYETFISVRIPGDLGERDFLHVLGHSFRITPSNEPALNRFFRWQYRCLEDFRLELSADTRLGVQVEKGISGVKFSGVKTNEM
ncbi:MAG: hypothetical protein LUD68_10460 [Rikenellaceae bacterium]|nr:hypothetical protein [Rikenellaceae bacterium]